jgi:hypothetical protein
VEQDRLNNPRRGRRIVAALVVAGVVAAVPAGVALAGGSESGDAGSGESAVEVQSTAPDGPRDGRGGDRGDCPKDSGADRQESVEL